MQKLITPLYNFTPGLPGVGTVNLSGIYDFDVKYLSQVINQTDSVIIYSSSNPSLKYTAVSGTTLTLKADTSDQNANDYLQVIYDVQPESRSATINTISGSGTIAAGAHSIEFIFSTGFAGTIDSGSFLGSVDASLELKAGDGSYLSSLNYNITSGTARLVKIL
jgi:hypothetical protein